MVWIYCIWSYISCIYLAFPYDSVLNISLIPVKKPFWKWLLLLHYLTSGFFFIFWPAGWAVRGVPRAASGPGHPGGSAGETRPQRRAWIPGGRREGPACECNTQASTVFKAVMRVRVQRWIISGWDSNLEGDILSLIILFTSRLRLCTSFTFWSSSRNKPDIMSKVDSRRKKVI